MKWKPDIIMGSTLIIVSARKSGKSVFAKYLCARKGGLIDKSDKVIVFTTGVNSTNWGIIPEEDIFIDYQPEIIENILEFQNKLKMNEEYKKPLPKITIIIDDLMVATTKSVGGVSQYDPTLWKVFSVGRHFSITLILISQSISLIGLNYLRNCDYFCWFKFFIKNDRKKLVEILGQYGDEKEIEKLITKPERYNIFILELTSDGYELNEKMHTFIVPEKFVKI